MSKDGNCAFGGGKADGHPVTVKLFKTKSSASVSKWGVKDHFEKAVCQLPRGKKAEWTHSVLSVGKIALLIWATQLSPDYRGIFWNVTFAVLLARLVEMLAVWAVGVRTKNFYEEGAVLWFRFALFILPGILITYFTSDLRLELNATYTAISFFSGLVLNYLFGPLTNRIFGKRNNLPEKLNKYLSKGFEIGKNPGTEHVLGTFRRFASWLY
ncbi:hypothetical protein FUAX_03260 [Fulvitalea axinellae]|uniref:Uncharacterized protein n=1 Tax=Fulvitalea axinellae TaxID=1182444 RepID=A0AAU9D0E8_9BACT|nr:hypothetical protein FUAX_03260 [Fulvitalea axinellae]